MNSDIDNAHIDNLLLPMFDLRIDVSPSDNDEEDFQLRLVGSYR
jgi:hypothetical protein